MTHELCYFGGRNCVILGVKVCDVRATGPTRYRLGKNAAPVRGLIQEKSTSVLSSDLAMTSQGLFKDGEPPQRYSGIIRGERNNVRPLNSCSLWALRNSITSQFLMILCFLAINALVLWCLPHRRSPYSKSNAHKTAPRTFLSSLQGGLI